MRIYLASGFTIMNIDGGEQKIKSIGVTSRLVSYHDIINTKNKAQRTIKLWINDENISCNLDIRRQSTGSPQ